MTFSFFLFLFPLWVCIAFYIQATSSGEERPNCVLYLAQAVLVHRAFSEAYPLPHRANYHYIKHLSSLAFKSRCLSAARFTNPPNTKTYLSLECSRTRFWICVGESSQQSHSFYRFVREEFCCQKGKNGCHLSTHSRLHRFSRLLAHEGASSPQTMGIQSASIQETRRYCLPIPSIGLVSVDRLLLSCLDLGRMPRTVSWPVRVIPCGDLARP
jgi:hypothetical protein